MKVLRNPLTWVSALLLWVFIYIAIQSVTGLLIACAVVPMMVGCMFYEGDRHDPQP